jgi:hypothetical protein
MELAGSKVRLRPAGQEEELADSKVRLKPAG